MSETTKMSDTERTLLERARHYCAMAEQCESGVRQKLIAWGAGTAEVEPVVRRLRTEGYLDDARYARAYCESKILGQHWGRQKVVYQLRSKRLPKEAIDSAMAAIDPEAYMAMLRETAERKLRELGGPDAPDADRRLTSFLASRGFTFSEINTITNTTDR